MLDGESFRRLVENASGVAIVLLGTDGTILSWNRGAERLFGWSRDEVVGQSTSMLLTADDRARGSFRRQLQLASSEEPIEIERWYLRRDRSRFRGAALITPVRADDGEVVALTQVVREVESRSDCEEDLQDERLHAMVESVREAAVFLMNAEGIITYWGTGATRMKQWTADEIIGHHLSRLYPPEGGEDGTAEEHLREAAATGEYTGEGTRLRRGVEPFPAHVTLTALRRDDGTLIGFSKITKDLTELRRFQAEVRARDEQYATLVRAIPQLLWTTEGTPPAFANDRWAEYTGLPATSWLDAVHPDDRKRADDAWREAHATGRGFEMQLRLHRRDGTYRWFVQHVVPIRHEESEPGWLGIATDVHDRIEAQRALTQAQKLESIGVLAGGIAHDFNNLLTGIIGNATLAIRSAETPDGAAKAAQRMKDVIRAGERAAQLTRQLLAYAGRGRLFVEPVDVCSLLEEQEALLRSSISRRVSLVFEVASDCPPVLGDAGQIQQLLMNLVINAAEAIGESTGTVWIRARLLGPEDAEELCRYPDFQLRSGPQLLIEVEDDGAGMDEETLARIYDPFFTTRFTGRGLGLAAALGIVRGHGGGIRVESELGRGTRFRVVLPVAVDVKTAEAAPVSAAPLDGTGRVLVVDDDAAALSTMQSILEEVGYEVRTARDGRQGVEAVHAAAYDLVVLDVTMPVMSGEEALAQIRESHPDLPVVVTSGYSATDVMARFAGQRVDGFLQKPFTADQMLIAVNHALQNNPS